MVVAVVMTLTTSSCVHEMPEAGENVSVYVALNFDSDLPEWHQSYKLPDKKARIEQKDSTRGVVDYGEMRYIIRAYTPTENSRAEGILIKEFKFTRSITDTYDAVFELDLPEGDYTLNVWSDILDEAGEKTFYNIDDFTKISLLSEHTGNTDHRDAFKGSASASLVAQAVESEIKVIDIAMQRPLAKFEFITTDLKEFVHKEASRHEINNKENSANTSIPTSEDPMESAESRVDFDDYHVVFYYVGFMPNVYNMFSDRPVDSATGVQFTSSIKKLNEDEASLGFDYVFVNGKESAVTVRIGLYDENNEQLAMTDPIDVPVKRSFHTVMRGSFMMTNTQSGVNIDPSYSGDYNIVIP